jgi:hypothetical protein
MRPQLFAPISVSRSGRACRLYAGTLGAWNLEGSPGGDESGTGLDRACCAGRPVIATLLFFRGNKVAKAKKKLSLKRAVEELTAIAEKHLATLPEEEQDARVASLARRDFKSGRGGRTKSSAHARTRVSRASSRGR